MPSPDFIGKQHAYRTAPRDDFGDAQLVCDQVDARAKQPPGRRSPRLRTVLQRCGAEVEALGGVDAPGDQAFVGLGQILDVIEFTFGERVLGAEIAQHASVGFDPFDDKAAAAAGNLVAGAELRALERSGVRRIGADCAGRRERDLDGAMLDAQYRAEPQFGFGQRKPALSR